MGKYLKLYQNANDAKQSIEKGVMSPHISFIKSNRVVNLAKTSSKKIMIADTNNDGKVTSVLPNNEIWYTSTDGNIVTGWENAGITNVISNTYTNGKGIVVFSGTNISMTGNTSNNNSYLSTNIQTIKLSDGISAIMNVTFRGLTNLQEVVMTSSITTIGKSSFRGCTSLTNIKLSTNLTFIDNAAFYGCSALVNISLPYSLVTMGEGVFYGCSSLKNIVIPESVTTLKKMAFQYCNSLESAILSNSMSELYLQTFLGCSALTNVVIPESITCINKYCFHSCTSLKKINLPSTITGITGAGCFCNALGLDNLKLPDSLITLGQETFLNDIGIKDLNFGENFSNFDVTSASTYGDVFPEFLENIYLDKNNTHFKIYDKGMYSYDGKIFYGGANWGISLAYVNYEIKEGTEIIMPGAFRDINAITTTQNQIDNYFNTYNFSRSHINLSDSIIKTITIPSTCKFIGDRFMQYCIVDAVYVKAITPPTLATNIVCYQKKYPIYVPAESVDAYKAAWPTHAALIQAMPS